MRFEPGVIHPAHGEAGNRIVPRDPDRPAGGAGRQLDKVNTEHRRGGGITGELDLDGGQRGRGGGRVDEHDPAERDPLLRAHADLKHALTMLVLALDSVLIAHRARRDRRGWRLGQQRRSGAASQGETNRDYREERSGWPVGGDHGEGCGG
jgi:hypothetical protein